MTMESAPGTYQAYGGFQQKQDHRQQQQQQQQKQWQMLSLDDGKKGFADKNNKTFKLTKPLDSNQESISVKTNLMEGTFGSQTTPTRQPQYPTWNVCSNDGDNQQYMMAWPWQQSLSNNTQLSPVINTSPYAFPDVEGNDEASGEKKSDSNNNNSSSNKDVELFQGVVMRPTPMTNSAMMTKLHMQQQHMQQQHMQQQHMQQQQQYPIKQSDFYYRSPRNDDHPSTSLSNKEQPSMRHMEMASRVASGLVRKSKPGAKQTSLEIYERFVKEVPGTNELDVSGILSSECYETWVKSRRTRPSNGPEAFRKTLVSYVTCADKASKPFRPEVERNLLKLLRQKQTWPCFEGMLDPITAKPLRIGSNGLRCTGYHEGLAAEAMDQANMALGMKRNHSFLQVQSLPPNALQHQQFRSQPYESFANHQQHQNMCQQQPQVMQQQYQIFAAPMPMPAYRQQSFVNQTSIVNSNKRAKTSN